jgi:exopolysaccharide production protein ExoQ
MTEDSTGRQGASRRRVAVLAASAALTPVLALIAPLGIAPLLTIAALAILALDGRAVLAGARCLTPFAILSVALSVWAMLSAVWSIIPLHSFLEGLRLFFVLAGGMVLLASAQGLLPSERHLVASCAAGGLLVAILFGLHEALTGATLTEAMLGRAVRIERLDRGATTLALALWPVLGARRRVHVAAVVLAAGAAVCAYLLDSTTAFLAVLAGFAVFAMAWFVPRASAAALGTALVLFAALAPLAVPPYRETIALYHAAPEIKWSALHRLLIWRFASDRIGDRPLLGWGMDASRAMPGGETHFADLFPNDNLPRDATELPLHPHDAALQWRLELGIPGTLFALALVVWCLWRVGFVADLSRLARASALGWAAAALVIALISYGIWQAWWLSTLLLTAAFFAAASGETPGQEPA